MKKHSAFSLIEVSIVVLILGTLIAGITQTSRLVYSSRLSNAQTLTSSSSISSIPNLTMWLETSLDGSVTGATHANAPEDGEALSAWIDRNPQLSDGRKIRPVQATSSYQPVYVAKGINNLPSIRFDGVNDHFRTASGSNAPIAAGSDNYTIIAVWNIDAAPSSGYSGYIITESGTSIVDERIAALAVIFEYICFTGGSDIYGTVVTHVDPQTPYISVIRTDHTSSANNVSIFSNSNTAHTGTSNGTPASLNVDNSILEIGSIADGTTYPFKGLISEILIFDRSLKNSEIAEINDYLSKKYSIRVN